MDCGPSAVGHAGIGLLSAILTAEGKSGIIGHHQDVVPFPFKTE
jgi:hypothetical protein